MRHLIETGPILVIWYSILLMQSLRCQEWLRDGRGLLRDTSISENMYVCLRNVRAEKQQRTIPAVRVKC